MPETDRACCYLLLAWRRSTRRKARLMLVSSPRSLVLRTRTMRTSSRSHPGGRLRSSRRHRSACRSRGRTGDPNRRKTCWLRWTEDDLVGSLVLLFRGQVKLEADVCSCWVVVERVFEVKLARGEGWSIIRRRRLVDSSLGCQSEV